MSAAAMSRGLQNCVRLGKGYPSSAETCTSLFWVSNFWGLALLKNAHIYIGYNALVPLLSSNVANGEVFHTVKGFHCTQPSHNRFHRYCFRKECPFHAETYPSPFCSNLLGVGDKRNLNTKIGICRTKFDK